MELMGEGGVTNKSSKVITGRQRSWVKSLEKEGGKAAAEEVEEAEA